jgi:RNA polymerase sigma factor (sigma-70 family)
MRLTLASNEVKFTESDEERFRSELARVEELVAAERKSHLHVIVSRTRDDHFQVGLTLDLPKRFLYATESDTAVDSAFRLATETLLRKLKRYSDRLGRTEKRKRQALSPQTDVAPLVEAAAHGDFEAFRANIEEHVQRLESVIKWELHHDARMDGAARARVSVEDLVDEVLADLFERYKTEPPALAAEKWMIRRSLMLLDRRIRETLRVPREQQPSEAPVAAEIKTEALDEHARLRDMFPDLYGSGEPTDLDRLAAGPHAAPGRTIEVEELRVALDEALADLPRDWRQVFSLHFLEGFDPVDIAELVHTSEDQVRQDIESSLGFLRARLR